MNIHPVGAKLFHVDRQDTIKLIIVFRNFVNAPKSEVQELMNTTHFLVTTYVRIVHVLALQGHHQAPVFIQIYWENYTEHSTILYNYKKFT